MQRFTTKAGTKNKWAKQSDYSIFLADEISTYCSMIQKYLFYWLTFPAWTLGQFVLKLLKPSRQYVFEWEIEGSRTILWAARTGNSGQAEWFSSVWIPCCPQTLSAQCSALYVSYLCNVYEACIYVSVNTSLSWGHFLNYAIRLIYKQTHPPLCFLGEHLMST
jgi:hypothetical protein